MSLRGSHHHLAERSSELADEDPVSKITPELLQRYREEAIRSTADLAPDATMQMQEFIQYLDSHIPARLEKFTKTKVNYLRTERILSPKPPKDEDKRTNYSYGPEEARTAIIAERLKQEQGLNIQEIKGFIWHLETSEMMGPPSPIVLAYTLLRNRTLGTLFSALTKSKSTTTPEGTLIGLRRIPGDVAPASNGIIPTWPEVHRLFSMNSWILAASDTFSNLYIFPSIDRLLDRPGMPEVVSHCQWYFYSLENSPGEVYEVIIGIPEAGRNVLRQELHQALSELVSASQKIPLSNYLGLATLLRGAFSETIPRQDGTALCILTNIIATTVEGCDYCAIMVPQDDESDDGYLYVKEHSADFPEDFQPMLVKIGESVPGWSFQFGYSTFVDPTVDMDPRLPQIDPRLLPNTEDNPEAIAAAPAVSGEPEPLGVIYVGRSPTQQEHGSEASVHLSEESIAGLTAFGLVCGDMIAREQVGIETVRRLAQSFTIPASRQAQVAGLEPLLYKLVAGARTTPPLDSLNPSWIYLLTLNVGLKLHIQLNDQLAIRKWLFEQAAIITSEYIESELSPASIVSPLRLGWCEVAPGQFVFAVLHPVDLPEEKYKECSVRIETALQQMRIGRLAPEYFLWSIILPYSEVAGWLQTASDDEIVHELTQRVEAAMKTGPHISRGHRALQEPNPDMAIPEFEQALKVLDNAQNSWYVYKHLAEARMLQGNYLEAIRCCEEALSRNKDYASASCLLADCLSYIGEIEKARAQYDKALLLAPFRTDFHIRYGIALAAAAGALHGELLSGKSSASTPQITIQRLIDEAIEMFDAARSLKLQELIAQAASSSESLHDRQEHTREAHGEYYFHRGMTFLQVAMYQKALEALSMGRKLHTANLQLAQAFAYAVRMSRLNKIASAR
jgi:tetratricopeptide (TPR) repeat protein